MTLANTEGLKAHAYSVQARFRSSGGERTHEAMIRPRKAIERLNKYRPPQEGRGGKMRLDFNENTVGCARQVVRALRRAVNPEMLTRYPEYDEGRRTLAAYFGVAPEEMLLANGTDDAIKMVCDTFVDPDDTLLVPAPTFPVYEFFHSVAGGKTLRIRYDENFRLPTEEIRRRSEEADRALGGAGQSQQPHRHTNSPSRSESDPAGCSGHLGAGR